MCKSIFAALLLGATSVLAAAPQHHDQVAGFYRLKVGDLEVTALYDGGRAFDPNLLVGEKATLDDVAAALREEPHMLDSVAMGFLVNNGKQLILVDAGAGTWWRPERFGRLVANLRSAGYTPEEVDLALLTHLHPDHIGGLTTHDGQRVFPNAEIFVSKTDSDYFLSPEIAANASKDAQPFFEIAQAVAAPYIKAGKWHTFSASEELVKGMKLVPLPGHTGGQTGYEFSSNGQRILFWGDVVHTQRVQLQHPEVATVYDIDQTAAVATRKRLLPVLCSEDVLIAGPHMPYPGLGRLYKDGDRCRWQSVMYIDRWVER
jgi:glyoxylase-like metal-dependent hydrolase (beta-lactamase superfamily II)